MMLCFYFFIRLVGYDLVLCLLMLSRSQEVDWSRSGGTNHVSLGYDSTTGQVFDVPLLRAKKRLKVDSATVIDFLGRKAWLLCGIQLTRINSCETEWREVGVVADFSVVVM